MSKTNELVQRFLGEPARNLIHAMYDEYVEVNVKFRSKSGIKTFIVRRQVAKCCDWCANLAGIYDYSSAPRDVYRRHDNCKCMVTFRNEMKKYTDAWSRKEYATQRAARKARIEEIEKQGNKLDELNKLKLKTKSQGGNCVDTTKIRLKNKITEGKVHEARFFKHKGGKLWVDGHDVVFEPSVEERDTAKLLIKTFGGTVELEPRVNIPESVNSPDYVFNGIKFDRKGPSGTSKNTILNQFRRIKGQSNCIVLDLSKTSISNEAAIEKTVKAFYLKDYEHLDIVIITRNGKIIKVFERT